MINIFCYLKIAYSGTGSNVMLPYPSIPTPSTAASNSSTYHGNSNTPYPLYNNQFPTPSSSFQSTILGPGNLSSMHQVYNPPYQTQNSSQNCPYPQPSAAVRPEYPPPSYTSAANTSTNSTTGVR